MYKPHFKTTEVDPKYCVLLKKDAQKRGRPYQSLEAAMEKAHKYEGGHKYIAECLYILLSGFQNKLQNLKIYPKSH